jgi:hypothetical protein
VAGEEVGEPTRQGATDHRSIRAAKRQKRVALFTVGEEPDSAIVADERVDPRLTVVNGSLDTPAILLGDGHEVVARRLHFYYNQAGRVSKVRAQMFLQIVPQSNPLNCRRTGGARSGRRVPRAEMMRTDDRQGDKSTEEGQGA